MHRHESTIPRMRRGASTGVRFLFLLLIFVLPGAAPRALAAEGDDARLAKIEARLQEIPDELAFQATIRAGLEPLGDTVRRDVAAARRLQRDALGAENEIRADIKRVRDRIKDVNLRLARLRSPHELSVALKNYRKSPSPETYSALYRAARGEDPPPTDLRDFRLHGISLEYEVRVKVVVPMGRALVDLGNVVIEIPEFAFSRSRKMIQAAQLLAAGGSFAQSGAAASRALRGLKQGPFRSFMRGKVAETLEAALDGFDGATEFAEGAGELVGESFDNILQEFRVGTQAAKSCAERMADEAQLSADLYLYGTETRALDEKLTKQYLGGLEKWLATIQKQLPPLIERRKSMDGAVSDLEERQAELDGLVRDVIGKIEGLENERFDLIVERDSIGLARTAAKIRGTACVKGISLLTRKGIDARQPISLAADDLTAAVLGLPRRISCRASAALYDYAQTDSEYEVLSKATGKPIKKKAKLWTLRSVGDVVGLPEVTVTASGPAVTFDPKRWLVVGSAPGEAEVTASTTIGVTAEKFVETGLPSPCNRQLEVKLGKLDAATPVKFRVSKVSGLALRAPTGGGMRTFPPDYPYTVFYGEGLGSNVFFESHYDHRAAGVQFEPEVEVESWDGKKSKLAGGRVKNADLSVVSSDPCVSVNKWRVKPTGPGAATLHLSLEDLKGKEAFGRDVGVRVVEVVGIERFVPKVLEERSSESRDRQGRIALVPIGEEFSYLLRVRAPDMSGYAVSWSSLGQAALNGQVAFNASSSFRKDGDSWVAECKGKFLSTAMTGGRSRQIGHSGTEHMTDGLVSLLTFAPAAEIYRTGDRMKVCRLRGKSVRPALPRVRDLEIVALSEGAVNLAEYTLYFPSPFHELVRLGVRLTFANGKSAVFPLSLARAVLASVPELFYLDTEGVNAGTLYIGKAHLIYRDNNQRSSEMGFGLLDVQLDAVTAEKMKLVLEEDSLHDSLALKFNKLGVTRVEEEEKTTWVANLYGPTDVKSFTARWSLVGGRTETTRWSPGAGGQVSKLVTDSDAIVEKVELVDPRNRVVAVYDRDLNGAILPPPTVSVYADDVSEATPGDTVTAHAVLHNLAPRMDLLRRGEEDCADFVVTWEVSPAAGRLEPVESTIAQAAWWCLADTRLVLSDDPELGNTDVTITAKLHRMVGNERIDAGSSSYTFHVHEPGYRLPTRIVTPIGPPIGVKVQFVDNIRGNNPFDPRGPVRNKNGRVYPTLEEMLKEPGGPETPTPTPIPKPEPGPPVVIGPFNGTIDCGLEPQFETYIASLDIDPATGKCTLRNDVSGRGIAIRTPPDADPHRLEDGWVQAFTPAGSGWTLDPPAARITFQRDAGNQVFRIRNASKTVVEIDLTVTRYITPHYGHRLTVNSVRQVSP